VNFRVICHRPFSDSRVFGNRCVDVFQSLFVYSRMYSNELRFSQWNRSIGDGGGLGISHGVWLDNRLVSRVFLVAWMDGDVEKHRYWIIG
jgi:hypothetical protein